MPTYRVVYEFAENNGSGFNEVYYRDADTAQLATATSANSQSARLALLHPLNTWLRIRTSNVAQSRDTGLKTLNLDGQAPADANPLPVGCSVVCNLSTSTGGSRKLWLRGCPATFYSRSNITGKDFPPGVLIDALQEWFSQLQKLTYGIRKLTPVSTNPASPYFRNPIKQVDGSLLNGTSGVTTDTVPTWIAGQRIVIGSTSKKDVPSLNGHFTVIKVVGAVTTIPYQTPQGAIVTTAGGYARQETYSGTAVFVSSACNFSNFGTRTSRSPLTRSRGARRAARLRLSR